MSSLAASRLQHVVVMVTSWEGAMRVQAVCDTVMGLWMRHDLVLEALVVAEDDLDLGELHGSDEAWQYMLDRAA